MSEGRNGGDFMMHAPLPYLVTARVVLSDDAPPETRTISVIAYSLMEAMLQATQQLGTGFDDARVKVERIEPDIAAYSIMAGKIRAALAATGE